MTKNATITKQDLLDLQKANKQDLLDLELRLSGNVKEIVDSSVRSLAEESLQKIVDDAVSESAQVIIQAVSEEFEIRDKRFDAIDVRFDAVDARFDAMDVRFDSLDREVAVLQNGMHEVNSHQIEQANRLSVTEASVSRLRAAKA